MEVRFLILMFHLRLGVILIGSHTVGNKLEGLKAPGIFSCSRYNSFILGFIVRVMEKVDSCPQANFKFEKFNQIIVMYVNVPYIACFFNTLDF